jgi:hypothetical protein
MHFLSAIYPVSMRIRDAYHSLVVILMADGLEMACIKHCMSNTVSEGYQITLLGGKKEKQPTCGV